MDLNTLISGDSVFMKTLVPALLALSAAGSATAEAVRPKAVIKTDLGDITVELYSDKAPQTVENFIGLATGTKAWNDPKTGQKVTDRPLYSGVKFHRTKLGFMIQGGDPAGTGGGDVGFTIPGESNDLRFDVPGRLAMANKGGNPSTAGSQFFITDVETPFLNPGPNGAYTIFGQVTAGMDVVKAIASRPSEPGSFRALQPVTIERIEIKSQDSATSAPASSDSGTTASE